MRKRCSKMTNDQEERCKFFRQSPVPMVSLAWEMLHWIACDIFLDMIWIVLLSFQITTKKGKYRKKSGIWASHSHLTFFVGKIPSQSSSSLSGQPRLTKEDFLLGPSEASIEKRGLWSMRLPQKSKESLKASCWTLNKRKSTFCEDSRSTRGEFQLLQKNELGSWGG